MATAKKTTVNKKTAGQKTSSPKNTQTKKTTSNKTTTAKNKGTALPKKETLRVRGRSPKDVATAKGEPYVAILSVDLDPDNIGNGAFELDWNDKFVANLVRAGYQQRPNEEDSVIVDRLFQEICRNIATENFEQWEEIGRAHV